MDFTFTSMIHFKLILWQIVSYVQILLGGMWCPVVQKYSLLKIPSPFIIFFTPLTKIRRLDLCASISSPSILFHQSIYLAFHKYHHLDNNSSTLSLEVGVESIEFNIFNTELVMLALYSPYKFQDQFVNIYRVIYYDFS